MTWEWYVFGALAGLVFITLIALLSRKKKPAAVKATATASDGAVKDTAAEPIRAGVATSAGGIHADAAATAGNGGPRAGHEYFPLVFQDDPYYRQRQQGYAAVPPPAQAYAYAPYEGPDRRQNRDAFAYGGEERRRARPDYIHDAYPADYAAGYADARREADAADNAATRELLNQILREARENRTNRARPDPFGKSTAQLLREVLQEVQQPQPQGYGVPVQQGYAPVPVVQTPAPAPVAPAPQQPQQAPGSPVTVNLTVPGNAPAPAPVQAAPVPAPQQPAPVAVQAAPAPEKRPPHTPPPRLISQVKVKNPDGTTEYTKTYQRHDGSKFTKSEIKDPQCRHIVALPAEPAVPGYAFRSDAQPSLPVKEQRRRK
ncbi:hypothetical protein FACS1894211_15050 [Clostridia bacterium]|nr:hypothetical protein FACS1894211_15050 [Clostridia bacterium]